MSSDLSVPCCRPRWQIKTWLKRKSLLNIDLSFIYWRRHWQMKTWLVIERWGFWTLTCRVLVDVDIGKARSHWSYTASEHMLYRLRINVDIGNSRRDWNTVASQHWLIVPSLPSTLPNQDIPKYKGSWILICRFIIEIDICKLRNDWNARVSGHWRGVATLPSILTSQNVIETIRFLYIDLSAPYSHRHLVINEG